MAPTSQATASGQLRDALANDFQALAFFVLVTTLLLSPVLLARLHPQDRQHAYQDMRFRDGSFWFVGHEIYQVKDDIDIVFAGPSIVWAGIDSPMVEQALTQKLGRQARVVTYGSAGASIDVQYMQIRDTLEHKKVGMVVTSVPRVPFDSADHAAVLFNFSDSPSPQGFRFLTYTQPPETAGLPLRYRAMQYAGYVLRSPHDFLDWFRTAPVVPPEYVDTHGGLSAAAGWRGQPYIPFSASSPQVPPDSIIYSPRTQNNFTYSGDALPPYQTYYLRQLFELLKARQVKLVFVNLPEFQERGRSTPTERLCWPAVLGRPSAMVGIPPATLFASLSQENIRKLYYDNLHFNRNGRAMFTRTIAPAIVELYANRSRVD